LLLTRYGKRTLEIRFRFPPIRLRRFKYDFSGNAIDLSLEPPFPGCLNSGHRFASATSGVIERLAPASLGNRLLQKEGLAERFGSLEVDDEFELS
jgi:hypothetical protein